MKKIFLILTIALGLMVGSVWADPIAPGMTVNIQKGTPQVDLGGEFAITTPSGFTFETFCIEHGETFGYGNNYIYSITNQAYKGGVDPPGDPLSEQSAWLYVQFRKNTLSNYNSEIGDARSLQLAFWKLEGEGDTADAQALLWIGEANTAVGGGWANNGQVMVINLGVNNDQQDMLTLVPEGRSWILRRYQQTLYFQGFAECFD